jgi:hypothetical protein
MASKNIQSTTKNNTKASKALSEDKKKIYDSTVPIFRIKPFNRTNRSKIRLWGYCNESEKIIDEPMSLNKPIHPEYPTFPHMKECIPFRNYGPYKLTGRFYRCNVSGAHIIVASRYPILYLDIEYERSSPSVTGSLFQLIFSIDMDINEKKAIKENKKYRDLEFSGTWVRHLDCDDELKETYGKYLEEILENEGLNKLYKSDEMIGQRDALVTEEDTIEWVNRYVESEKSFYDNIMNEKTTDLSFLSIERTRDELLKLCCTEKFNTFLRVAMMARDLQRRRKFGITDEDCTIYEIPDNIIKLDDVRNKMIEDDELILDGFD